MPKNKKRDDIPQFQTVAEYESLSAAERDRIDEFFTREIPLSETRALTVKEKAKFERARARVPGRPKVGGGAKVVAVTLEKGLLEQVDAYAKGHGLKRSEMITRGLRLVMGDSAA